VVARLEPIRQFLRYHPLLLVALVLVLVLVAMPIAAFSVWFGQQPSFAG